MISADARELRRERAGATGEAWLAEHERINLRKITQSLGHRFMRGAVGGVKDDEEIDIRNAFDRIPPDGAAVDAARVEVRAHFANQAIDGATQRGFERGDHVVRLAKPSGWVK